MSAPEQVAAEVSGPAVVDLRPADAPRAGATAVAQLAAHLDRLTDPLALLRDDLGMLASWGARLAACVSAGGRVLAAGNGGSATQAQHLTTELVGRYLWERPALDAVSLTADSGLLTALGNDYGWDEVFARQVRGLARPGDVVVLLSTSGRSGNVLQAATAAKRVGATTLALTGRPGNPLSVVADEALCVDAPTPTVQEVHQIAIHMVCLACDLELQGLGA